MQELVGLSILVFNPIKVIALFLLPIATDGFAQFFPCRIIEKGNGSVIRKGNLRR
jgi:hypothetical protein